MHTRSVEVCIVTCNLCTCLAGPWEDSAGHRLPAYLPQVRYGQACEQRLAHVVYVGYEDCQVPKGASESYVLGCSYFPEKRSLLVVPANVTFNWKDEVNA